MATAGAPGSAWALPPALGHWAVTAGSSGRTRRTDWRALWKLREMLFLFASLHKVTVSSEVRLLRGCVGAAQWFRVGGGSLGRDTDVSWRHRGLLPFQFYNGKIINKCSWRRGRKQRSECVKLLPAPAWWGSRVWSTHCMTTLRVEAIANVKRSHTKKFK